MGNETMENQIRKENSKSSISIFNKFNIFPILILAKGRGQKNY